MLQRPWEKDCFFQSSLFLPLLFLFLLTTSLPQDSTQYQGGGGGNIGLMSAVAILLVASLELVSNVHQVRGDDP